MKISEYTNRTADELSGADEFALTPNSAVNVEELTKRANIAIINSQTGTSYTLLMGDLGKTIDMSNASANTLTVPPSSSVDFPIGTQIVIWRMGVGITTVVAGSGVTINTANSDLSIAAQYSAGVLRKVATDSWVWAAGGASGTGLTALTTPASLTMTPDGENDMDFAWADVANESGFTAQIAEDAGFTVNVQTVNVGAGVLVCSFSGLTEGTTYYGRVKAEGDLVTYSDSGYATDSADTDDAGLLALNAPTSFVATVDGSDIDLTWTDTNSSPNEVGYEIIRNTTNTTLGGTLIHTSAANATSYTDTAPGAGTWYYFCRAKGNLTTSAHSTYASDDATISGTTALKDLMAWTTFHDPDADVTTRTSGADTFAVTIKDQMALGTSARSVTNATNAEQPKLLPAEINGKSVIWLHGDAMRLTSTAASITLTKPFTRCGFTVLKSFRAGVRYSLSSYSAGVANDLGSYDSGGGQRHFIYAGSILYEETTIDNVALDTLYWHHMEFQGDGSTDKYYRNNVLQATGNAGSTPASQSVRLGGNSSPSADSADAYIGVHCIFPGIMTAPERTAVWDAVKAYYAIP